MCTEIFCTKCGEVISVEGTTINLPYVCPPCEQKEAEFHQEAETVDTPGVPETLPESDGPSEEQLASLLTETIQFIDKQVQTIKSLQAELNEANLFEAASYRTINKLFKALDHVAAERDNLKNIAIFEHSMRENREEALKLAAKVIVKQMHEHNALSEKLQKVKQDATNNMVANQQLADALSDAENRLRYSKNEVRFLESRIKIYRETYRASVARNAELFKRNAELFKENLELREAPWYKRLFWLPAKSSSSVSSAAHTATGKSVNECYG